MKDRLNSLYRHSSPRQLFEVIDEVGDDLLQNETLSHETDNFLQEILLQRQKVVRLRQAAEKVSQLHRLLLAALDTSGPDIEAVDEMVKTLDAEFKEVDAISASICQAITVLKESAMLPAESQADHRIRKDQLMGLTESLRLVLIRFNRDYLHYEEASRTRAVEYSKREKSMDTEARRVLNFFGDEEEEPNVMGRPQLVRTISAYQTVLQEVKERQGTIERVEQSIDELGRLFQELRVYIDTSNDLTNHIESNIEKAGEYVEKSRVETAITVQRKEDVEKGRGWMGRSQRILRLLIIFLVSVLVLLILTFFSMFLRVGLRL